jgi:hypothetical protein
LPFGGRAGDKATTERGGQVHEPSHGGLVQPSRLSVLIERATTNTFSLLLSGEVG